MQYMYVRLQIYLHKGIDHLLFLPLGFFLFSHALLQIPKKGNTCFMFHYYTNICTGAYQHAIVGVSRQRHGSVMEKLAQSENHSALLFFSLFSALGLFES